MADNIAHANMLFYPLYYDIISPTSLKITQTFRLLLGFAENQVVFWDFKNKNSIRITEGLDNGDSDNRGSTVYGVIDTRQKLNFSAGHNIDIVSASLHSWYIIRQFLVVYQCLHW